MKNIRIFFAFTLLVFSSYLFAQEASNNEQMNIFEELRKANPKNGAVVKIHQDDRIEAIFRHRPNAASNETVYRIQVFSSNIQRTAKTEAYNIEKMMREQFPEQNINVNYTSPFWKVRMGEFKTRELAQDFRTEVMKAFPKLRNEIYVVREQPQ